MLPPVRDLRPASPDPEIVNHLLRLRFMRYLKDHGYISDYAPVPEWTDEAIFRVLTEVKATDPPESFYPHDDYCD